MYEITASSLDELPEDIDGVYEDPRILKFHLARLEKLFPGEKFVVFKNGVPILVERLPEEIRNFEIGLSMSDDDRVPTGFRRAWGCDGDDVARGTQGRVGVWRPKNPED